MSLPAERFACHAWDDGWVVYDRHRGDTHAMSRITASVFRALLNTPDADDGLLSAAVRRELPTIDPDELALALRSARSLLGDPPPG